MTTPKHPWTVPVAVHDIPETGRRFDLIADEAVRRDVAAMAGVRAVPRLTATFEVVRHGRDGLRVIGAVSARVEQTCVVTLEPIEDDIEEPIDLVFAPRSEKAVEDSSTETYDAPEPLIGGTLDLGAVAVEFLVLAIDPYPRKPGAIFDAPPTGDDGAHPFAALAALKKGEGGTDK
jgi:uncharacterized metal-binding protein YceD (DUF177 family)